ncbi:MAG: DUF5666 domain-containing protein [Gammaproteobacteria bacterium]|nr:DUF5666 domain-containing protein [Gammaproteobacteria bacterium]MDH5803112.1 DUF5666 domain-containing protein [Gammaproteobacteria bacterium]
MNIKKLLILCGVLATTVGLWACSDSGNASLSGNSRTIVGVITGFGSVFVNGTEYETSHASITVNGQSSSESDLAVGMPVALNSSADGTVTAINTANELEGIVLNNDMATNSTLNIMGLTVVVDNNTLFESKVAGINSAAAIAPGNIVEVYGFNGDNDQVFATRLEVYAANIIDFLSVHPQGVEVKAALSNLDSTAKTFMIGTLPVSYNDNIVDSGPLVNGQFVEVKSTEGIVNNVLIAGKVEPAIKGVPGTDSGEFETRAKVTRDYDGTSFGIAGVNVIITSATEYRNGASEADLVGGTLLKVEGHFDSNGDVVAKKVELEIETEVSIETEGFVSAVETSDVNIGTVSLESGRSFEVNNLTVMVDNRSIDRQRMFNLSMLAAGDYIKAGLHQNPSTGSELALKLKRDDAP